MTGRLDLGGGICVRLRGAADAVASLPGAGAPDLLGDLGGLPLRGSALVRAGRLDSVTGCLITSRPFSILAVHPAASAWQAARWWRVRLRASPDRWHGSFPADSVWIGTFARRPCPDGHHLVQVSWVPAAARRSGGRTLTTLSEWIQR
jgi:hypothetical protein